MNDKGQTVTEPPGREVRQGPGNLAGQVIGNRKPPPPGPGRRQGVNGRLGKARYIRSGAAIDGIRARVDHMREESVGKLHAQRAAEFYYAALVVK